MHAAQAPLGKQIGAAGPQSALPPHARQVRLPESQTGVVPLHCAFETQATQVPLAVSQTGVAPLQRVPLLAEQTPQAPLGWQAGRVPPHSLSPAHPRQAWVDGSHTGALALPQSASAKHATQVPGATLQIGVAPVHAAALVLEHWPQAPNVWQAGVAPLHSLSPLHARHACAVVLHTGVEPPHCPLAMQVTQVPDPTAQTGVAPPQALALVLEHWPHAPDVWQAGVAPPQSPSRAQARQTCVPVSQIGVPAPHCALLTQETQVPLLVLQYGVAPLQAAALAAEHWPQAPEGWQAGLEPLHSPSPPQPRQL